MSQPELLRRVLQALDVAGIEHLLSGSFASSLQGEPRSTHDIDIVVDIQPAGAAHLIAAFRPPQYYLSADSVREAITHQSMFNLLDVNSGDKVDFWILTDDPFDRSRFARRYTEEVMGMRISVSSPEDTILMKLNWAIQSGGSEKQFKDALGVYEVQQAKLDLAYMDHWARELSIEELWRRLRREAEAT
ncbi:MAG: hypothetical protein KAY24_11260 [Candidatus Eisenbacteria sp.]|nr:hypothetical protein [Candidatus Eisenbacteria bacterium]